MGYYTFSKLFLICEEYQEASARLFNVLDDLLEKAINFLKKYLRETTNNKILSDIIDAKIDLKNCEVHVDLELDIIVSPLSPYADKERELVENAVKEFFKKFYELIKNEIK